MRNLAVVVDRIMAVTLVDEVGLRRRLRDVASDRWKPPEQLWGMGAQAFHDRFGDVPPTEGWGKTAVDIWMGVDVQDEEDGIGGAVVAKPTSATSSGSDWFFVTVATLITLACVAIAFYFRAP
jgi:hypothetical protein